MGIAFCALGWLLSVNRHICCEWFRSTINRKKSNRWELSRTWKHFV